MNSARVRESSLNRPRMALVVVDEFCFSTPRIAMHRCTPSSTTATPTGLSNSCTASAIWVVRRSCTCKRRAYRSVMRANLDSPRI